MNINNASDTYTYNDYNEANQYEPYVFVSYSHADTQKVQYILRLLYHNGVRYWWDQVDNRSEGIPGGMPWTKWINNRFKHSRMFLCFLSNGIEQRSEVLREIDVAIRRTKTEDYKVLFILLEKLPSSIFDGMKEYFDIDDEFTLDKNIKKSLLTGERIKNFINQNQCIFYSGVTEKFVNQLLSRNVFPKEFIDDAHKEDAIWQMNNSDEAGKQIQQVFFDNTYICETMFPEKSASGDFYQVKLDEVSPDAGCLIVLDNQYCPAALYHDKTFKKHGFESTSARQLQIQSQQQEIYRALLHRRQLIINRAFIYNSAVLENWFNAHNENSSAFWSLIEDGSILIYLMKEDTPYDPPKYSTSAYEIWKKYHDENPNQDMYCLKLEWNDKETNSLKIGQLLGHRFISFCLTLAEDSYRLKDLKASFDFTEDENKTFDDLWKQIEIYVAKRGRIRHASYTREKFYKKFIVKKGTDVVDCIIDDKKRSPKVTQAVKEIIDLEYGLNLPYALGVHPIYPKEGHLKDFYSSTEKLRTSIREITSDELTCSIKMFKPSFLKPMPFPKIMDFSLKLVTSLRQEENISLQWKLYNRTIINGQKRANLQEVDYYDIQSVWTKYHAWLSKAHKLAIPDIKEWQEEVGALSIIYRLGTYEIVTVYTLDMNTSKGFSIKVLPRKKDEHYIDDKQNHTVLLTIDYVCGDVEKHPLKDTPLLDELRLFEGITKEKLSDVYMNIIKALEFLGAEFKNKK